MIKDLLYRLAKIFCKISPLYIVGGYVRDKLIELENFDIDLCSALTLDKVTKLLEDTDFKLEVKNKKLGTGTISNDDVTFEYSTFRVDYYNTKKRGRHNPEKTIFTEKIEEDFTRRDFTINALYYDILNDTILDFATGIEDIKEKRLRKITAVTLDYDGERILRLIRFAVKLDFDIENNTLLSAKQNAKNVLELSEDKKAKFEKFLTRLSNHEKAKATTLLREINLDKIFKGR